MKNNKNQEAFVAKNNKTGNSSVSRVRYGADTSGCSIDCVLDFVRERAYQLFQERGRQPGHELDDWLQAEREIKAQLNI